MKAIRLLAPGKPLELQELDEPAAGPGEVVVRVRAAGICHSDAHYRAGVSPAVTPLTLGHEIAGNVDSIGPGVADLRPGDRVCVHYLQTCGACDWCRGGTEQFCVDGRMIGKHRDGGFAEKIAIPARNVFPLPPSIPFSHGAILMCSSATSLHALRKARLAPGESVAVFGIGGLGASAVQLARALGARIVYAVDRAASKLALAERLGAVPVDASTADPVARIRDLTRGRGVDVALELIGLPITVAQAVRVLGKMGRAAVAGLSNQLVEIDPYRELINQEAELVGVSDHLASEIPELLSHAASGRLDLSEVVGRTVPLEAPAINGVLDSLSAFGNTAARTVIEI